MGQERRRALPADVKEVRARIERWRRTRQKRTKMPEPLWQAAVSLARTHGMYVTARALRLGYDSLKSRVGASGAKGPGGDGGQGGFVELSGAQLMGSVQPLGPVLELSDADGAKLMIRLAQGSEVDVGDLAEAFWRRRSCCS